MLDYLTNRETPPTNLQVSSSIKALIRDLSAQHSASEVALKRAIAADLLRDVVPGGYGDRDTSDMLEAFLSLIELDGSASPLTQSQVEDAGIHAEAMSGLAYSIARYMGADV